MAAGEQHRTSIRNVEVDFPFPPYDCQVTFMEQVLKCLQSKENGVLESPTGTGKTLSLLCASLAWKQQVKAKMQLDQHMMKLEDGGQVEGSLRSGQLAGVGDWSSSKVGFFGSGPQIIYASRTHTQLSQAMAELKRSPYGHLFKACILGAREQFCIHDEVQKTENHSAKVHLCRAKVKAMICPFYNKLHNKDLNDIDERLASVNHDIEDLVQLGKKNKVCPYYVSRQLRGPADVVFTPYNYLLDPKARRSYGIELSQNVVIFDEAHNLEQFCEETSSFNISSYDISTAIEAVDELMTTLQNQDKLNADENGFGGAFGAEAGLEGPSFTCEELQQLRIVFKLFEENLDAIPLVSQRTFSKPGAYLLEIFSNSRLDKQNAASFLTMLDNVLQHLNQSRTGGASPWSTKTFGLEKFLDLINCVFSKDAASDNSQIHWSTYYRVHVGEEETWQSKKGKKAGDPWASSSTSKTGRVLNYWCFSPGHCMREVMSQDVHCLILTSGTLAPLSSFTSEMQLPFKVTLENPHIIQKNQFWVGTLPKGPDGTSLCSSYQNRFDENYQLSLGNTLVNLARITPEGMLVFFPSYGVMSQLTSKWEESGIWSRISQYKPVFKEPKTKSEFQATMKEYYANISNPSGNGAIFMAVCRGKVSEGLDFADMNGRAVVITGLPYPPRMDPRVVLKMDFLTSMRNKLEIKGLGGEDWYKQQAFRAVNQAIGRVIRHKSDWGAIILCDQRFGSSNASSQLPLWVRPYVTNHLNFGNGLKSLVAFFKEARATLPSPSLNKNIKAVVEEKHEHHWGSRPNNCLSSRGQDHSDSGDAFEYKKRIQSKSNSVEYHATSLDAKPRRDQLVSTMSTPPTTQRKRPLKIEYDEAEGAPPKKPTLSSVFEALEGGAPRARDGAQGGGVRLAAGKSEEEAALERRMANQVKMKKKIKVGTSGGLINQVLKKTIGVTKPFRTSTPKRSDTSCEDISGSESTIPKELSSILSSEESTHLNQPNKNNMNLNPLSERPNALLPNLKVGRELQRHKSDNTDTVTKPKPPASTESKEKAAQYLSSVKKCLKEHLALYQQFTGALKRYQKDNDYQELTKVLVDVFLTREDWFPLLRGFYHFMRINHKNDFSELCLSLTGTGCEQV